ncbi:putative TPR domain protein [Cladorrhinum samala]|uniref:TPR domain protein n=1 Tax=Cladorrhinum samala TaxID=585594 RepID=A0AAV9HZP9_9PEZI|nr:putative TPR domain protein [Cladorrhinum samala]
MFDGASARLGRSHWPPASTTKTPNYIANKNSAGQEDPCNVYRRRRRFGWHADDLDGTNRADSRNHGQLPGMPTGPRQYLGLHGRDDPPWAGHGRPPSEPNPCSISSNRSRRPREEMGSQPLHDKPPANDGGGGGDDYFDLGGFHMPVTCKSPDAQKWFSRGLVWCYGFNHEEGARCFERAAAADPDCAMAYWGLAYAIGPNYNKPWGIFDATERESSMQRARKAALCALERAKSATPVEQALIDALQHRYPKHQGTAREGYKWNRGFADAMEKAYSSHSSNPDVTAVYVDALLNLTPWDLWNLQTGEPAEGARTLDARTALETALATDPYHPGLLHLYIHLMEMSPFPEKALNAADSLRGLVPDAGHLNHMPTHIDIICGDYRRAISSNTDAVRADAKFVERNGAINFYSLYRCHDLHFRLYGAMFAGQSAVALETAKLIEEALPEDLLLVTSPPMADWLEGFLAMRVHALVRFGRWDDIISLPLPGNAHLYCSTTAMILYAKGVALANTGRIAEAVSTRDRFQEAVKLVPKSRTVFNNTCRDILGIAAEMLNGELEYRRGNIETGLAHLRKSIELDDALPYDEPWGWMQPTRHAYGALLLEQDRVEQASAVYAADLGFDGTLPRAMQHRNNVWSLHGYHECLTRLGRCDEAKLVRPQLQIALAVADVPIQASCFCRKGFAVESRL